MYPADHMALNAPNASNADYHQEVAMKALWTATAQVQETETKLQWLAQVHQAREKEIEFLRKRSQELEEKLARVDHHRHIATAALSSSVHLLARKEAELIAARGITSVQSQVLKDATLKAMGHTITELGNQVSTLSHHLLASDVNRNIAVGRCQEANQLLLDHIKRASEVPA